MVTASAALHLLVDELKSLRKEGMESVYVSDEALERLQVLGRRPENREPRREVQGASSAEGGGERGGQGGKPSTPEVEPRGGIGLGLGAGAGAPGLAGAGAAAPPAGVLPPPPEVKLPAGDKRTRWEWLRERVLQDPVCRAQVKPGKQVVFGVGNLDAEIFFCGEAPGEEEEIQGEPFVGPAGQLLTKIIQAMGLTRSQVYIGNIMNWRPDTGRDYGNRPPTGEELRYCLPFLRAQVEVVSPKVIVALGGTAVRGLQGLAENPAMGKLRGHWLDYAGTPVMVTYHPSYLLRNQAKAKKREVWEDMLLVMERVGREISEKQRGYFL